MARIRVGIGGWVFPAWRGVFYPPGLPQAQELAHASRRLTSIEINATFYGAQKPASFRRWHGETPEDFVFSVKGPRFATHRKDLAGAGPTIERFFATGVLELDQKLGPILWQFPPFARFAEGDFAAFLALLPRQVEGRAIRHVVEARHRSFFDEAALALLRRHSVALALVDDEGRPDFPGPTADFVYVRLRRTAASEPTGYAPAALDEWVGRFRAWATGGAETARDCFVYFISGAKERAPAAAEALIERLTR
jgi:uncharacterized protein YecE (DUF72 family)